MGTNSRAFTKQGAVELDAIAAALQPKFTITAGPEIEVSHTWLDTFDWRLHEAGISLEYLDDGPLIMQFPDGNRLQGPRAKKWPALLHDLPAGRLRDALEPIVAPRALLSVVTVQRAVRESRVLNPDEKTVARLLTESSNDGTSRLQVQPLRGYEADGDRIARLMGRVDGLTASATTPYDDALTLATRSPNDQEQNLAAPLQPETPAPVAVANMLAQFAAVIDDNVAGTIAAIDIEFLHDLRVAVRRTRSILKLAGDVLPANLAERFQPEFKWLGDLTTPVRDLDVYLLELDNMAAGLASADPHDLDPFRSFLVRHRAAERRRLVRGLRSQRFKQVISDWRTELAKVATDSHGGPAATSLARQRIERAFRNVVRRGKRITADSPSEQVHELRKRCKELRYLLEVFRPLFADAQYRPLIKELKALQDTLGDFQDGEVQREAVREFAAVMMEQGAAPPATVLAMGELAAQLDVHQLNARGALVGVLRPFLAKENRARVKALVR
ncbi:MAG TPA: CHAD domain-containing protein [Mycobacterium sp.]|nr:CHAD domain-containing protein [Mycobacterium sp.]